MSRKSLVGKPRRAGLTLVELLLASAMMVLLSGVLSGLAVAVRQSWQYADDHTLAAQHARICSQRIRRALNEAYATPDYPGAGVVTRVAGGKKYPDTLVVWRPAGTPANPDGPPLVEECVLFCPDPDDPSSLVEITLPGDAREVPPFDQLNVSPWLEEIEAMKVHSSAQKVLLTDHLRAAATSVDNHTNSAVLFSESVLPSAAEWADYQLGDIQWEDLSWPRDWRLPGSGIRQTWIRFELQLVADTNPANDPLGQRSMTFPGSATLEYSLTP